MQVYEPKPEEAPYQPNGTIQACKHQGQKFHSRPPAQEWEDGGEN